MCGIERAAGADGVIAHPHTNSVNAHPHAHRANADPRANGANADPCAHRVNADPRANGANGDSPGCNPGLAHQYRGRPNGADGDSPGCNPGLRHAYRPRPNGADGSLGLNWRPYPSDVPCAPLGRGHFAIRFPGLRSFLAPPWAITVSPVGAAEGSK